MFTWKSVVGKLWMTIIGLVAVVLLILSLFISQLIDTFLSNTNDQRKELNQLADKVSVQVSQQLNNKNNIAMLDDLLHAQNSGLIVLDTHFKALFPPTNSQQNYNQNLQWNAIFSAQKLNQVLQGNKVYSPTIQHNKSQYVATAVPLRNTDSGNIQGAVILYQSLKPIEDIQFTVKKLFFITAGIGFLLTTFFAFFLSSRITRPLLQLKKAADLITMGEYRTRVVANTTDEIGQLAITFNHMAEQLDETIKDLQMEKEHLASVLRSMTDAVITFDANGNIILTNPQGDRIIQAWSHFDWTENEESTSEQSIVESTQEIPKPLFKLFSSVVQGSKEISTKIHVHNGVWSVVMAPLYSREMIRGAVAVLRDVTEEHRLDKLKKDFVANVSHELRTPLSMLQGYSEALIDDIAGTPIERKELVQVIHDESVRMGRLVRDLLDLARMEAGHIEFHYGKVDIIALLQRVQRKFSVLCKERGISLQLLLNEDTYLLEYADEDRLEQVLTNLLDNAIRHSPSQSSIDVKLQQIFYKGRNAVQIDIVDHGEGIPTEDLPYIFERFYKADKARTRGNSVGTGLGLSIVKNLVDAHQGKVSVRSVHGQGTTFSVTLPQKPLL